MSSSGAFPSTDNDMYSVTLFSLVIKVGANSNELSVSFSREVFASFGEWELCCIWVCLFMCVSN